MTGRQADAYGGGQDGLEPLLLRVAAGDREAFSALYRQARGPVYALVLSLLKNADDAQDVTQDAFVRIWDEAGRYSPRGTPMAWMLTVARNLALMRLRERGRFQELDDGAWNAIPARDSGLTAEDRDLLQNALGALGDQERQVVLLHAVSGLKHREIAQLLRKPLSTVLSQYQRALKKLKVILEGENAL